jgi:hypothetical protein
MPNNKPGQAKEPEKEIFFDFLTSFFFLLLPSSSFFFS